MTSDADEMPPVDLVALADRGWPALETIDVGGWLARFAGGVTKRANSVLPGGPVPDIAQAIQCVESLYRARGIRAAFQLIDADDALERVLRDHGYTPVDETLIMVRRDRTPLDVGPASGSGHRVGEAGTRTSAVRADAESNDLVRIADEPDDDWLDVWWSVDGRGGDPERRVARRIMVGAPALYASLNDMNGTACVGRLALVDGWGGLYAVATRVDARRRGHALTVLARMIDAAAARGVSNLWLQVLADNPGAIALYRSLGFTPAGGYRYLIAPDASLVE